VKWMVLALLAVAIWAPALANESAEEPEGQAHHGEELERNEVGVFLGITAGGDKKEGGKEDPTGTIGVEYRRRLSRLIGVGLLFEFAGGERRDHVGLVPVSIWLGGTEAQLIVGAGWERSAGHDILGSEYQALGRLGFGYSIELVPGNVIRPEINVDIVDGEAFVVIGASIGWDI